MGDGRQRTATGQDVVTTGAQTRQERSAQHPYRAIITHVELSEMVGVTRRWISMFMQRFHNVGLIETNADQFLIIREKKLTDYLAQLSKREGPAAETQTIV